MSFQEGQPGDQYDEDYDWDTELHISETMEFSGPDEDELEAAMIDPAVSENNCEHVTDGTDCTCDPYACDECDCDLIHSGPNVECACEDEHYASLSSRENQFSEWGLEEDQRLVALYCSKLTMEEISTNLGLNLNLIRKRLLFLCFESKGTILKSTVGVRSGKRWTEGEEIALRQSFIAGVSVEELASIFQRSMGALASRLIALRVASPIDVHLLDRPPSLPARRRFEDTEVARLIKLWESGLRVSEIALLLSRNELETISKLVELNLVSGLRPGVNIANLSKPLF